MVLEQVAGQGPDRVGAQAAAVPVGMQEEVEGGVPVVGSGSSQYWISPIAWPSAWIAKVTVPSSGSTSSRRTRSRS